MGWYSWGPGGAQYKYGDVTDARWETGVGTVYEFLRITPFIHEDLGELELYGQLQHRAIEQQLPWKRLDFQDTKHGHVLPHKNAPHKTLDLMEEHINTHAKTVRQLLGVDVTVTMLLIEVDFVWEVPTNEIDKLYTWLRNVRHVEDKSLITKELCAQGDIDVWYRPPEALETTFQQLTQFPTAHFIAHMLGAYAVDDCDEFEVEQPGDDHQRSITLA